MSKSKRSLYARLIVCYIDVMIAHMYWRYTLFISVQCSRQLHWGPPGVQSVVNHLFHWQNWSKTRMIVIITTPGQTIRALQMSSDKLWGEDSILLVIRSQLAERKWHGHIHLCHPSFSFLSNWRDILCPWQYRSFVKIPHMTIRFEKEHQQIGTQTLESHDRF